MTSKPRKENPMSCYKHFTTKERESLLVLLKKGQKNSEIAKELGRSPSSISREIRRNAATREDYSAIRAEEQYRERRKRCVRHYKLSEPDYARKVSELLAVYWSPEEISGRLKLEGNAIRISTCTIYRGLENGLLNPALRKKLRIKGRTRCGGHKKSKCGHLDIEYTIHDRPKSVESRKTIGHWEGDTVRGAKWSGCIGTQVERVSRYAVLFKIPDRTAASFTEANIQAFEKIPKSKRRSFTVDHGKEFSQHRELSAKLNCKVYFADPHAPWQRGTNENFNGLLRQFFPKRTSFAEVTQSDVDAIASLLNRRPRKSLGWRSPEEVFFKKSLHLT